MANTTIQTALEQQKRRAEETHEIETMAVHTTTKSGPMNIFANEASFSVAARMANALAGSTVIPREYQKNPSNCLIAIEMAARINTSPMMVMQNLYIVNGRPAWSSQWIIAMINQSRRYQTELQFEFGHDEADGGLSCRAWAVDRVGHRVDGPKITMKMAQDEGWVSRNGSKWKTMPEVMIRYRAASFFGRVNCPDMVMGIYTRDEIIEIDNQADDKEYFGELPTEYMLSQTENEETQTEAENADGELDSDPATGEVVEPQEKLDV